jgi:quercetin dioxygenase-like cupin family protein
MAQVFVTEGACTVWVSPDTVRVDRGDYCAIALNTPHAIKAGPDAAAAY